MKNPFLHNHRYLAVPLAPLSTTPQVLFSLFIVTIQRIRFLIFWNFRSCYRYVINLCLANSQRSYVCYIVGILSKLGFSFLLFWRCILFRLYMAGRWIENLFVYNYLVFDCDSKALKSVSEQWYSLIVDLNISYTC